jgi:uncharacterized damage-inducible protein DinB
VERARTRVGRPADGPVRGLFASKGGALPCAAMDGLRYALLHNSWATRRLIEVCRSLTPEQLAATTPGAADTVLRTVAHVTEAEGRRFRTLLTGTPADWSWNRDETPSLDTLAAWAEDNERFWIELLGSPVDAERVVKVDWAGSVYDVTAGVVLAQAIHHGNAHREQVCTILTVLGLEAPDLSGWGYGGAHGHIVEASPAIRD